MVDRKSTRDELLECAVHARPATAEVLLPPKPISRLARSVEQKEQSSGDRQTGSEKVTVQSRGGPDATLTVPLTSSTRVAGRTRICPDRAQLVTEHCQPKTKHRRLCLEHSREVGGRSAKSEECCGRSALRSIGIRGQPRYGCHPSLVCHVLRTVRCLRLYACRRARPRTKP